jgi:hypothetical protein
VIVCPACAPDVTIVIGIQHHTRRRLIRSEISETYWISGHCLLCDSSGETTELLRTTFLLGGYRGVIQLPWWRQPHTWATDLVITSAITVATFAAALITSLYHGYLRFLWLPIAAFLIHAWRRKQRTPQKE